MRDSEYPVCRGLGALIAEKFAAEGCNVAINYVANSERAKETAEKIEKAYQSETTVIQGVCVDILTTSRLFP